MNAQSATNPAASRRISHLNIIRTLILMFAFVSVMSIISVFVLPRVTADESLLVISQLISYAGMALGLIVLPILIIAGLRIRASHQKTGASYPLPIFIAGAVMWLLFVAIAIYTVTGGG
jgi:hypothetical protein